MSLCALARAVAARGLDPFGATDDRQQGLEQFDRGGAPFVLPVVEDGRLPGGRRCQPLAPVEQPADAVRVGLQRFDAVGEMELVQALTGGHVRADVLWREEERHGLPSRLDHESGFRPCRDGQQQPRSDRQPVHRALRVRAEGGVSEQSPVDAGGGSHATVARVKHHGGVFEPDDHPSCAKRLRLQLDRLLVEQLDAFVGRRGLGDLGDGDRGEGAVGAGIGLHLAEIR